MKKSFLNRAMAAAIAVPVALSQTVLFTSFAAGENAAAGTTTFTIDDFVNVPVKDSAVSPIVSVSENDDVFVYEKESIWNSKLESAINQLDGTKKELDIASLVAAIKPLQNKWYTDIIASAISGTVEFSGTEVTIALDVVFPEEKQAELKQEITTKMMSANSQIDESVINENMTLKTLEAINGQIVLTADTANLNANKEVSFSLTAVFEGNKIATIDDAYNYGVEKLEALRAELKTGANGVLSHYQAEKDAKQAEKDDYQEQLNEKIALLEEKQAEKDAAQEEVNENKSLVDEKQAQLDELEEAGTDTTEAQKELDDANKKLVAAQEKLDNALKQLDDAREQANDAQKQLDDAQKQLDDAQKQLDNAGSLVDTEIDKVVDGYLTKLDNMKTKADNSLEKNVSKEFTGTTYDAVLGKLSSYNNKYAKKIPQSLDAVLKNETIVSLYAEVLKQVNGIINSNGYAVEVSLNDVVGVAKEAYDVSVTADYANGAFNGYTEAYLADVLTDEESQYYYDYFTELLADKLASENKKIKSIDTEKELEFSVGANYSTLSGAADLAVKRIITVTLEEDITDTDATESDTDVTETDTDVTESGTDTTETDTDVTESGTDATETDTDVTESGTDATETDTDVTESGTDATETDTDVTESNTDETESNTDETESNTDETESNTDETESNTDETESDTDEHPVAVKDISFDVDGNVDTNRNFYFSHDARPFEVADLIRKATYTDVDGEEVEITVTSDRFAFGVAGATEPDLTLSPKSVFVEDNAYTEIALTIFYKNDDGEWEASDAELYVYIGVKGDADLDGAANAADAAAMLVYAAAIGAGDDTAKIYNPENAEDYTPAKEALAWFLADVSSESRDEGATSNNPAEEGNDIAINSGDAAYTLTYATAYGTKFTDANWVTDVFRKTDASATLPKFTEEIYNWEVEHAE